MIIVVLHQVHINFTLLDHDLSCCLASPLKFCVWLCVYTSEFPWWNNQAVLTSWYHVLIIWFRFTEHEPILEIQIAMWNNKWFCRWIIFDQPHVIPEVPVVFLFENLNLCEIRLSLFDNSVLWVLLLVDCIRHEYMIQWFTLIELSGYVFWELDIGWAVRIHGEIQLLFEPFECLGLPFHFDVQVVNSGRDLTLDVCVPVLSRRLGTYKWASL